ncbi:oxidoreductase [Nocardia uniformis]|uniref:Oxidoreductase n=1 Tax=Nocardia uniformis TaxID=53432 RepID=A0A849BNQ7_9NOCA|nr:PDR/VanB family oxidoreductase [Nocardia uniformis]NNH68342.1 oxidoreductase [Nocardia uniformis]
MTEFPVRVVGRRDEAENIFSLVLAAADGSPLPAWSPGAHIDVRAGDAGVRQYSLCGDPADRQLWQIAVLYERNGRGGSAHLHRTATPDTELRVSLPRNNFALTPRSSYVFIAGGIGITPILPMIAAAQAAGARWRLYYGARSRAHMAFADHLGARYREVTLVPQDVDGLLPLPHILEEAGQAEIYCCGPEPMLASIEQQAATRGSTIRTERFAARPVAATTENRAFDVRLDSTGVTYRIDDRRSIADVLEAAGIDIITSCREGTCGSCETAVLRGDIDHRDEILTAEERARGNTMMLCVSRAHSDTLVLDL